MCPLQRRNELPQKHPNLCHSKLLIRKLSKIFPYILDCNEMRLEFINKRNFRKFTNISLMTKIKLLK